MPTRTQIFLTPEAQPLGKELKAECGSFKNAVSAGIIALARLSAEEQKSCVRMATGLDPIDLTQPLSSERATEGVGVIDEELRRKIFEVAEILELVKKAQEPPVEKPHGHKAKSSKAG